ncbi:hypothetical protein MAPG_00311 [Magnaporthiopsis poae ATCC 64411]|uniref:Uncharacterized protein n=1 Tax=Magnaporthiopsis poae (strain ATCC 64411 / 73-15) TaxID=644358 RepID=A0A0C4DKN3_MAGP6|nr:hypothetical protein MAPG_00311 [Magnaporthiopsis poae ATCC 64411]
MPFTKLFTTQTTSPTMNNSSSSRSAPPAPLDIRPSHYSPPGSPSAESAGSSYKDKTSTSYPLFYSMSPRSYSDATTAVADDHHTMRTHRKPSSPTGRRNANSYCGRHSSEWLFSGWSMLGRKGST